MLPRRYIEKYLFFLLRHRWHVIGVIGVTTAYFIYFMMYHMAIYTNFFDLYPPGHPYIQLYTKYRDMFGTANIVLLIVEVKDGDIFDQAGDHPEGRPHHARPAARHPRRERRAGDLDHAPEAEDHADRGLGHQGRAAHLSRVSRRTKEDLAFLRQKVYTTEGVHGLFVSDDDKATLIVAGFWEEYFDLAGMWKKLQEIVHREEDANTKIYVTGFADPLRLLHGAPAADEWVLVASVATMIAILWLEFRSWQGVVIPVFCGTLSAIWGLGFGGVFGLSLDPLVLVIPLLITARAHSHSVQSMERYHEEYHRLRDKDAADRQVVHRDLRARDGVDARRRARDPHALRGTHSDHPEARAAVRASGSSRSSSASSRCTRSSSRSSSRPSSPRKARRICSRVSTIDSPTRHSGSQPAPAASSWPRRSW